MVLIMPIKTKSQRVAREADRKVSAKASSEKVYAPFSPDRAFVVQFRTNNGALTGRVEHIASGDAVLFWDQHELFNFFGRILGVSRRSRPRTGKED
jgi:hypothetical protein